MSKDSGILQCELEEIEVQMPDPWGVDRRSPEQREAENREQWVAYHLRQARIYHDLAADHAAKADRLVGEG